MLLTEREKEILHLILRGYSSNTISEQLFCSVHTINTHRKRILQKLECRNVASLLQYKFFL
jgi:DNA-binding CsgD family transcriptional regulator